MSTTNGHDPEEMDHSYDGITELDSLLPAWWLWLFWLCIIFGLSYLVYYHVLKMGPLSHKEYEIEMQLAKESKVAFQAEQERNAPPVNYDEPSKDPAIVGKGEAIFAVNCVVCHMTLGQGLVGPNLTDDYWIHGGTFPEIRHTITEGVPAKGMITWKEKMGPRDIHAVASYVWSIHGRDVSKAVPPPKAPEPEAKLQPRPAGT
jgi:cytochrome c oxidase cbb3-type subunit 3